jgi:hypothetical protein
MNTDYQIKVRRVLYGNAIFCGVSGLGFALAPNAVSPFLGLDASLSHHCGYIYDTAIYAMAKNIIAKNQRGLYTQPSLILFFIKSLNQLW